MTEENRGRFWDRLTAQLKTDDLFHETEIQANRLGEFVLLCTGAALGLVFLLTVAGVFPLSRETIFPPTLQGIVEIIVILAVCRYVKDDRWWLKYLLMLSMIGVYARLDAMLTHKAAILMIIPVVFSSRYFSRTLTMMTAAVTVVLFAVTAAYGAVHGMIDLNIVTMDEGTVITATGGFLGAAVQNAGVADSMLIRNTMLYNFVPKLLMFAIVSMISWNIALRGRNLVLVQHQKDLNNVRIASELNLAHRIQVDMLPSSFPPYPERKDFDVFASMRPAKEVGGDFYDFFMIDEDHLGLVIADVSGKGVPAALFMMIVKILVQNAVKQTRDPAEVLRGINEEICRNNREEMFITIWLGILDTRDGKLTACNAGHEYPIVMQHGEFTLLKDRHGFVIGGMSGAVYKNYELQLEPGDKLFVYTDGVPESTDAQKQMFGLERMLKVLNEFREKTPEEICTAVKNAVRVFSGNTEQFDDITMMCVSYTGTDTGNNRTLLEEVVAEAKISSIETITDKINRHLDDMGCPEKTRMQIDVALDEILSNIANYAYEGKEGKMNIRIEKEDPATIIMTFTDSGMPFDPLSTEEPDTSLSAEERQAGGLGIFLVKKMMDKVVYEYRDGHNVLTVRKEIS